MIVIDVLGSPAPKGNARAFVNKRTGRAVLSSFGSGTTEKRLRSWDALVREAAYDAVEIRRQRDVTSPLFVDCPLAVGIVFRLSRPAGHYAKKGGLRPTARVAPTTKPDADKLARSTLDALHGTIFDDDSRIVELGVVKTYAEPGREGARIVVKEWKSHG
jgi:Holliday junction resolvase RusA-like endonuclease